MILNITDNGTSPTGLSIENPDVAFSVQVSIYRQTGGVDPLDPTVPSMSIGPQSTEAVPLPIGTYILYGVSDVDPSQRTPLYQIPVTDGSLSPATRSRSLIADRIRSLALPVNVYEMWNAIDWSNVEYPCIILSVDNVRESAEKSFNVTDDIGHPAKVSIIDTISKTDHTRLPDVENWRYRIERAFRGQQLPMLESVICRVEYDSIVDPTLPPLDVLSSEFVIRHITREYRGL